MRSCAVTDVGQVRHSNQDFVYASDQPCGILPDFYMVADGMGGHQGGGFASRYAAERLVELLGSEQEGDVIHAIRRALKEVNFELYQKACSFDDLKGMGTTVVAAVVDGATLYVANIGDSRLYVIGQSVRQITRDHSLVNDMLLHGEITKEEAENYPQKNVLTNALGVWETVRCDIETFNEKNDGFLICSDGLHGYVDEDVIAGIVLNTKTDPARRTRKLIEAALDAGGYDNVTEILIDLEDSAV